MSRGFLSISPGGKPRRPIGSLIYLSLIVTGFLRKLGTDLASGWVNIFGLCFENSALPTDGGQRVDLQ